MVVLELPVSMADRLHPAPLEDDPLCDDSYVGRLTTNEMAGS
jgi:hypothetical protein